ncbi:hypothetical protein Ddc_13466 [Ditylenchus destructor]|nr:hypothetical protein Ddc_13466 [Ditylenchus destructor]
MSSAAFTAQSIDFIWTCCSLYILYASLHNNEDVASESLRLVWCKWVRCYTPDYDSMTVAITQRMVFWTTFCLTASLLFNGFLNCIVMSASSNDNEEILPHRAVCVNMTHSYSHRPYSSDLVPTARAIFDDIQKMSREWIVKNNVIVIGIVAGLLNFVYFCLHVRNSAALASFSFLGLLTCVVLALGGIEKKYKYTYWPFMLYYALDFYAAYVSALAHVYVLISNNLDYLLAALCTRCYTTDFGPRTDIIPLRIVALNSFCLLLSLLANGFFACVVLFDYEKTFAKSPLVLPAQMAATPQESLTFEQQEMELGKSDKENIELGNMRRDSNLSWTKEILETFKM